MAAKTKTTKTAVKAKTAAEKKASAKPKQTRLFQHPHCPPSSGIGHTRPAIIPPST